MKINFNNIQGFAFKKGTQLQGNEVLAIIQSGYKHRGFNTPEEVPDNWIPFGTVEWCDLFLTKEQSKPNYFPAFTAHLLHRYIYKTNMIFGNRRGLKKLFIKPADKYKRFDGFIGNTKKHLPDPPYIVSEVVKFINEWRYYISNGEILFAEWYKGDEINTPDAPQLDVKIPENWCGTLDMGTIDTGELAIVEAHKPYATGLYGCNNKLYIQWLINGWKYLYEKQ